MSLLHCDQKPRAKDGVAAIVLVTLLVSPWSAVASGQQQEIRSDVETGVRQVREADFEGGVRTLEAARKSALASQAREVVSRVDVYLAMAYFELNLIPAARARLMEAWEWDHALTLSSAEFAPRFIEFFKTVRNEIDEQNRRKGRIKWWLVLVPVAIAIVAVITFGGDQGWRQ